MRISKRDLAQLSAYLDGELSQRELKMFENRMEGDPDFQAALEDLRNVKIVLTHTPRLAVPRNFTLKPSPVKSPQRRSPAFGYRLAAAAMSFLFIGVVVLDIGSGALKGGMLAAEAPRSEEVMVEAAADEVEEPSQLVMEKAAEEAAPSLEMEVDAEAPEIMDAARDGEADGMTEGELNLAPEETDRTPGSGEDIAGDASQDPQRTPLPSAEAEYLEPVGEVDQDYYRRSETSEIPWLRILEIMFGLGAVGLGITAWLKRSKNHQP